MATGKVLHATFAHDEKRYKAIKAAARARAQKACYIGNGGLVHLTDRNKEYRR